MLPYLELIRPGNCLMSVFAVFIGGLLVIRWDFSQFLSLSPLYLALIAVLLITGAGNAINDYVDVEADRVNKPKRPVPSGRVPRKGALALSLLLFALGIALAGIPPMNMVTFAIAVFNSFLLVLYSFYLQGKLLAGNLSISYLAGSTFLFGGASLGDMTLPLILGLLAGLATFSREIVKDVEDMEGDKLAMVKKLAKRAGEKIREKIGISKRGIWSHYGTRAALSIAALSLILAIIISPVPYVLGLLGISYLILVIITDAVFASCILGMARAKKRKDFSVISTRIKTGMNLGFLAFVIGVLF
jgi:geranylgeranylglycerol-phosphate geranylgeranyltransferase